GRRSGLRRIRLSGRLSPSAHLPLAANSSSAARALSGGACVFVRERGEREGAIWQFSLEEGAAKSRRVRLSGRRNAMDSSHLQYPPVSPTLFTILLGALAALFAFVQLGILNYAYRRLGLSPNAAV